VTGNRASGPAHGFGIVGAGTIAAAHAHSIAAIPAARLVAVSDVATEPAAAFARRYGCAAEPDLDSLLARDDIDVVTVSVPSGLHAEVGVRAAAAGKHLVVEKPIDVSLAAADRLIAAARQAGVALTVISQPASIPASPSCAGCLTPAHSASWCSARPAPSGTAPRPTTTARPGAAPGSWTAGR
jgi:predicted homoserine dehydrogenase-like protein